MRCINEGCNNEAGAFGMTQCWECINNRTTAWARKVSKERRNTKPLDKNIFDEEGT